MKKNIKVTSLTAAALASAVLFSVNLGNKAKAATNDGATDSNQSKTTTVTKSPVEQAKDKVNAAQKDVDTAQKNLEDKETALKEAQNSSALKELQSDEANVNTAKTNVSTANSNVTQAQSNKKVSDDSAAAATQKYSSANDKLIKLNSQINDLKKQNNNSIKISDTEKYKEIYQKYENWDSNKNPNFIDTLTTDEKDFLLDNYDNNNYQSNDKDKNESVDLTNLTDDQVKDISSFATDLLNGVRTQLGSQPMEVTNGDVSFVQDLAKEYTKEQKVNFDQNVFETESDKYNTEAEENLYRIDNTNSKITMDDLKENIYDVLTGYIFMADVDDNDNEILDGDLDTAGDLLGLTDDANPYLAVDASYAKGSETLHFVTPDENLADSKISTVQDQINEKQNEAKSLEDTVTKLGALTKTKSDETQAASVSLQEAQEKLATAKQKLTDAENKLNILKSDPKTQKAQDALKTAQDNYDKAKDQLNNARENLNRAQQEYDSLVNPAPIFDYSDNYSNSSSKDSNKKQNSENSKNKNQNAGKNSELTHNTKNIRHNKKASSVYIEFTHNSLVYTKLGKRYLKAGIIKKGKTVKALNKARIVRIKGKKYYQIGKNKYIKVSNARVLNNHVALKAIVKGKKNQKVYVYTIKGNHSRLHVLGQHTYSLNSKKAIKGKTFYKIAGTNEWMPASKLIIKN